MTIKWRSCLGASLLLFSSLVYAEAACEVLNQTSHLLRVTTESGDTMMSVAPFQSSWFFVKRSQIKVGEGQVHRLLIWDTHESCVPANWGWYLSIGSQAARVCATKRHTLDVYNTHAKLIVIEYSPNHFSATLSNDGDDGVDYPHGERAVRLEF